MSEDEEKEEEEEKEEVHRGENKRPLTEVREKHYMRRALVLHAEPLAGTVLRTLLRPHLFTAFDGQGPCRSLLKRITIRELHAGLGGQTAEEKQNLSSKPGSTTTADKCASQ